MTDNPDFVLTPDQEAAIRVFNEFYQKPVTHGADISERYMVLTGYAGCGKTTTVNYILDNLENEEVAITAPTHKALSVLRSKTNVYNFSSSLTIHSLLNLRLKKKNHKEILVHDEFADPKIPEFNLIIVDECSMVGGELFDHLNTQIEGYGMETKVLFVGDSLQLPPVNEEESPTFKVPAYRANLDTVVRQALDNPIINLTVQIRKAIKSDNYELINFETTVNGDNGVQVYGKLQRFKKAVFEHLDKLDIHDDVYEPDKYKLVAWRNRVVNSLNDQVRKHINHGDPKDDFLPGERITVNDSIMLDSPLGGGQLTIPRDTEGQVISVEKIKVDKFIMLTKEPLDAYKLRIKFNIYDATIELITLSSVSQGKYNEVMRYLASSKNWPVYWKIKEYFIDIRQIHAITSHKSQGSTYEECFVDVDDILSNPNSVEALKCLYVAVSRASKRAHLLYQ